MRKRYFATLFDKNYLVKGLAMIRSLMRCCESASVFVLCLDQYTKEVIDSQSYINIIAIPLSVVETQEVLAAKQNRTVAEYCWTLSSVFTWHVLDNYKDIDLITYLDADIYFYSSVEPVFDEIRDSSIAIIEHRFTPRLSDRIVNGRFCVQWCSFRRDYEGLTCLSVWRQNCLDWCYYRVEDGKMGDQKYLDSWPTDYYSCCIINHLGAGVAPWNYPQYAFWTDPIDSIIMVNIVPLIFYHFHQFQILGPYSSSRLSSFYTDECAEPDMVYLRYENEVFGIISELRVIDSSFHHGFSNLDFRFRRLAQCYLPLWLKDSYRYLKANLLTQSS